jgi:hypothetical protein
MKWLCRLIGSFLQVTAVLGGSLLLIRAGTYGLFVGAQFIGPLLLCALWGTVFWKVGRWFKDQGAA